MSSAVFRGHIRDTYRGPAMWVGNIPSDATEDEVMIFVSNALLHPYTISHPPSYLSVELPTSIYLMNYTNCAFVNFHTNAGVAYAVTACSGKPLRPNCRRLQCKERSKHDGLTAGVNVQRGKKLHKEWAGKANHTTDRHSQDQVDAGYESGTSTDSEVLAEHFPMRYFILKSSTEDALDECLRTGIWRTQNHNEGILDKAFRTSSEVILLFSVNRSREFRGFARMTTHIQPQRYQETVYSHRQIASPALADPFDIKSSSVDDITLIPVLSRGESQRQSLQRTHSESILPTTQRTSKRTIDLCPNNDFSSTSTDSSESSSSWEPSFPCIYTSPTTNNGLQPHEFRVDWRSTEPVPFHKFFGLKNPWNLNKPVQIARDGTEIEPLLARKVLSRWRKVTYPRSFRKCLN